VARRSSKPRRRAKSTIPMAVVLGALPGLAASMQWLRGGFTPANMNGVVGVWTGFNVGQRSFSISTAAQGLMPLVIGLLAHKFIGQGLGINRVLASARIPFIRF